jgi:hypothetical protein
MKFIVASWTSKVSLPWAGFPIGPNLKGTVYTGQTLRVTLNTGDIDKLDGISIWCADANANFGDATF